MVRYKHTQVGWVTLTAIGAGLVVVGLTLPNAGESWIPLAVFVVLVVAMVAYSSLTVTITDDTLEVRYGPGLIRRRYPLVDIRLSRIVRNPFYYGWGTRMTPHGWLFNVSGFEAVEVEFKTGKKIRAGTNEPQALDSAIREAIHQPRKRRA